MNSVFGAFMLLQPNSEIVSKPAAALPSIFSLRAEGMDLPLKLHYFSPILSVFHPSLL